MPNFSNTVKIEDTAGNSLTSTGDALDVNLKTSSITLPVSGSVTATISGIVEVSATGAANTSGNPIFVESITGSTTAVTQATGSNLHAVLDSGSTTAVTQTTGTNLHTVVDSGSITTVQATGTNLHTVVDSGTVTATVSGTVAVSGVSGVVEVSATGAANTSGNPIFVESITGSTTTATQATGTNLHTVVDSGAITVSGTAQYLKLQVATYMLF